MISEAGKSLKINEAFPRLFSRSVPRVKPGDPTLKAIHTLLSDRLDVLLLTSEGEDTWSSERAEKSPRGISGYSIASRLVNTSGRNLDNFTSEQCSYSALTLGAISFESDDLQSLLHMFEVTSLGYSIVSRQSDEKEQAVEVVSLKDFLPLYAQGKMTSELKVKDVASSPVAVTARESTLMETLTEMIRRKFRRAKIADSKWELITDRDILEIVFPFSSNEAGTVGWIVDQLKKPISEIMLGTAPWIDSHLSLFEAAKLLAKTPRACALSQAGIITPWDVVIKPWRLGSLELTA